MAVKKILEEVEQDIFDVAKTDFDYINTNEVPRQSDTQLTYETGKKKVGKIINTCVLYVDVRNSVGLTEKLKTQTMGRLYTAFTKSILKIARHHNGHIRNIIGDRIMIVFPVANCFTNAIDCAISINHIASKIISKAFPAVDFKCGIGIDFGELRVIKVGTQRRGHEHGENRGLVWAGYPANIASRLTDVANKKNKKTIYEVTYNPINPSKLLPDWMTPLGFFGQPPIVKKEEPYYLEKVATKKFSQEEFANAISSYKDGQLELNIGQFIKLTKENQEVEYPAILITASVYAGLKAESPKHSSLENKFWKEQTEPINNVSGKVFGAIYFGH